MENHVVSDSTALSRAMCFTKCFQDEKLCSFELRHPELPCHIRTLGNKNMETHLSNFQNRAISLHQIIVLQANLMNN